MARTGREEAAEAYPSFSEVYPAIPESVSEARSSLGAFAAAAGATGEGLDGIRLAVSEAVTNAVMHAYERGPGCIYVTAALTEDEIWVLVADRGRGLNPRASSRGLGVGLALIAQMSDEFAIVKRAGGGTEVRMRFGLSPAEHSPSGQRRGSLRSARSPATPVFSMI